MEFTKIGLIPQVLQKIEKDQGLSYSNIDIPVLDYTELVSKIIKTINRKPSNHVKHSKNVDLTKKSRGTSPAEAAVSKVTALSMAASLLSGNK